MPNGAGDPIAGSHPRVGVLALQGAFAAHQQRLHALGVDAPSVRTPDDLVGLDGIVLPGGESTTMSHLLTTSGLFDELKGLLADGLAVFGTCAGMILCATEVSDARPDQRGFDLIDIAVRRNGYGRQLDSFEADLDIRVGHGAGHSAGLSAGHRGGPGGSVAAPFHAVFIRAPLVERVGPDVEVIAEHEGVPVLVRDGRCTVAAFHPELTDDTRLHRAFVESI